MVRAIGNGDKYERNGDQGGGCRRVEEKGNSINKAFYVYEHVINALLL